MENGFFLELKDRPFGKEFEDDNDEYTLLDFQLALYYRRQYKKTKENYWVYKAVLNASTSN